MNWFARHLRQNVVAYLALFVAMGGTSYAAIAIRNNSINPIKLNRKYIGGYIRAWASVSASGQVLAGSPGASVILFTSGIPGNYAVQWHRQSFVGCVPQGGVVTEPGSATPGFAMVSSIPIAQHRGEVTVGTLNDQGAAVALPFYVSVICPTP